MFLALGAVVLIVPREPLLLRKLRQTRLERTVAPPRPEHPPLDAPLGFRVQVSGCGVQHSAFSVQCLEFSV